MKFKQLASQKLEESNKTYDILLSDKDIYIQSIFICNSTFTDSVDINLSLTREHYPILYAHFNLDSDQFYTVDSPIFFQEGSKLQLTVSSPGIHITVYGVERTAEQTAKRIQDDLEAPILEAKKEKKRQYARAYYHNNKSKILAKKRLQKSPLGQQLQEEKAITIIR